MSDGSPVVEGLEGRALFTTLPAGFVETTVTTGVDAPTAMAFAPDGRLFVAEQTGDLRVIKNGALLPTPFVSLNVDSAGERGLLGVAFDPAFASNHFVYVYHTVAGKNGGAAHNRVSRLTASGDVAAARSARVILDLDPLSSRTNHNGGAMQFGPDGKLYVAVGENANRDNAQSLSNRLGKILRVNADGSIPADNPFYAKTTGANRAIWAIGLRNPFSFDFRADDGLMFLNDVGQNTWEEIDVGVAGANYGWPAVEGPGSRRPRYRKPIFAYQHGTGPTTGDAIVGAAFYDSPQRTFPRSYKGDYFFADLSSGWIRRIDAATNADADFAQGINVPVALAVSPFDGALYYAAIGDGGVVRKIQYGPGVTSPTPAPGPAVIAPARPIASFAGGPAVFDAEREDVALLP